MLTGCLESRSKSLYSRKPLLGIFCSAIMIATSAALDTCRSLPQNERPELPSGPTDDNENCRFHWPGEGRVSPLRKKQVMDLDKPGPMT